MSTRAPSLGRGCRAQRGGVGFRSRLKRNGKRRFLVSSSRAQPRDLFRLPFAVFLRKSICMKHRDPQSHEAYGVSRSPLPSQLLPDRERKRFLAFARNDNMGKAAFSYRSLPHWGRGTASAVDRVLSYIVDLRRSPSLSFIPLSPSNLRPFGAPPSRGRREYPYEPLPLEGAAERSEAGLAFFFCGEAATTTLNPEP